MPTNRLTREFAKAWLQRTGWTQETTILELAARIEDTCEDFEAELATEYGLEGLGHDD